MIAPSCFAGSSTGASNSSSSVAPDKTLTGKATYYPDRLNGHETASGDRFHQSDHTAASNKLPLGTTAKVTNLKTGKSTDVTVTDRGPALGSRKIDLTNEAAKDIGLTRKEGVAPVTIEVESRFQPRAFPHPWPLTFVPLKRLNSRNFLNGHRSLRAPWNCWTLAMPAHGVS